MQVKFKKARTELTEDTRKLINQWTKKDLEDFTEYLFKNRRKDRKEGGLCYGTKRLSSNC